MDKCSCCGIPIAANKTESLSVEVTFLGILTDTIKDKLRLPQDKITQLRNLLGEWRTRRSCTWTELGVPDDTPEPHLQGCEGRSLIPQAYD